MFSIKKTPRAAFYGSFTLDLHCQDRKHMHGTSVVYNLSFCNMFFLGRDVSYDFILCDILYCIHFFLGWKMSM